MKKIIYTTSTGEYEYGLFKNWANSNRTKAVIFTKNNEQVEIHRSIIKQSL